MFKRKLFVAHSKPSQRRLIGSPVGCFLQVDRWFHGLRAGTSSLPRRKKIKGVRLGECADTSHFLAIPTKPLGKVRRRKNRRSQGKQGRAPSCLKENIDVYSSWINGILCSMSLTFRDKIHLKRFHEKRMNQSLLLKKVHTILIHQIDSCFDQDECMEHGSYCDQ